MRYLDLRYWGIKAKHLNMWGIRDADDLCGGVSLDSVVNSDPERIYQNPKDA